MSYFNYNGKKIYFEEYGSGETLVLLHGNTVSSKLFTSIIPLFAKKYHVITMDFLGCGKSDRVNEWPIDLWYEWSKQVIALLIELKSSKVKLVGCSGGALVAINVALEKPELVECVVADSFEGIKANTDITEQIKKGRELAKQNIEFCNMLKMMHGIDWEKVIDADTKAIVTHAKTIGTFFHKPIEDLKVQLFLTGSCEDEMFPKEHFEKLFKDICYKTHMAKSYLFKHGGHPAMMSNVDEYILLLEEFFNNKIIETGRLKIYVASEEQMKKFIEMQSIDELKIAYKEMLDGCMKHPDEWEWYAIWMIELKDGTHIGELCFKGVSEDGVVEIGYGIKEDYQNQGFATEAVKEVVDWALNQSNVICVKAEVEESNVASKRVLEKVGFSLTGKRGEEGPIFIRNNRV